MKCMPKDNFEIENISDYIEVTMRIMEKIEESDLRNKKKLKFHIQNLLFKFIGAFRQIEQFQMLHERELQKGITMDQLVYGKHIFLPEAYSIDSFHYYVKSCIDTIPRILSFYYHFINENWTISRKRKAFIKELRKHDNPLFKKILADYDKWMHGIAIYRDYSTHQNLIVSDTVKMTVPDEEGKFDYYLGLPVLDIDEEGNPVRQRYEYRGRCGEIKTCDKTAPAANTMIALFLALQDLIVFLFEGLYGLKIGRASFLEKVTNIESKITALQDDYVIRVRNNR